MDLTIEALMERVTKMPSGCWEWSRGRQKAGYGSVAYRTDEKKRFTTSHRLSYELHRGPIPTGLVVRHRCDNPPCVNPDHLELGTQADNVRDTHERGRYRHATKLTAQQVREIRAEPTRRGVLPYLVEKYGVSRDYVVKLRAGHYWKGIDD